MKTLIEIIIGVFAGYCSCYFIADKFMGLTPEQVTEKYVEIKLDRLKNIKNILDRNKKI